jgi:hypothetical protein
MRQYNVSGILGLVVIALTLIGDAIGVVGPATESAIMLTVIAVLYSLWRLHN